MELNREQIIKALEWAISGEFCENCLCTVYGKSMTSFLNDALALINSQETEYNELYELLQTYKADSEAYRSYNKTLEKENEALKTLLDESYDTQNSLTEENERLSKEFVEYIKTAPIVKIDEGVISEFAIKRAIRNYELHFGKSAKLDQIAKEMLEASSQKELSVVSDVANAQKQRAEPDECTESRYATMFQEEKDNG